VGNPDSEPQPHPDIGVREVHEIGNRTYLVADVEPLDVTGLRTVSVGTALFLLAGLALLPFYGWLEDHDREWWLWTCAAGFGLGLFGYDHCRRRARYLSRQSREVSPDR
jgi:hypothetical protein